MSAVQQLQAGQGADVLVQRGLQVGVQVAMHGVESRQMFHESHKDLDRAGVVCEIGAWCCIVQYLFCGSAWLRSPTCANNLMFLRLVCMQRGPAVPTGLTFSCTKQQQLLCRVAAARVALQVWACRQAGGSRTLHQHGQVC